MALLFKGALLFGGDRFLPLQLIAKDAADDGTQRPANSGTGARTPGGCANGGASRCP